MTGGSPGAGLAGRSILVVEDEMLIALLIEDVLIGLAAQLERVLPWSDRTPAAASAS